MGDGWPQAPKAENSATSPPGAASKLSHLHGHLWAAEPQKEGDKGSGYDSCGGSSRRDHSSLRTTPLTTGRPVLGTPVPSLPADLWW